MAILDNYNKPTPRWAKKLSLTLTVVGASVTGALGVAQVPYQWIIAAAIFTGLGKLIPELFSEDSLPESKSDQPVVKICSCSNSPQSPEPQPSGGAPKSE